VLLALCAGQFLMALDSSVMNVSIATVADDLGTTITGIQTAIVLYTLVMAMLMVTGGKIGSMIGRSGPSCSGCQSTARARSRRRSRPTSACCLSAGRPRGHRGCADHAANVALVAGEFPARGRPRAYGSSVRRRRSRSPSGR
jgi:hypothetical protein